MSDRGAIRAREIIHGFVLSPQEITIDADGRLCIMAPGEPVTRYYLKTQTKIALGLDMVTSAAEDMRKEVEHMADVNISLNNELVKMERKYEGRGEDE